MKAASSEWNAAVNAATARDRRRRLLLVGSGIGLSALSLWVLFDNAHDEPYAVFRPVQFAKQVGLGGLTLLSFIVWAIACVRALRRTPHAFALGFAALLWTAIHVFILSASIHAYQDDLKRFAPGGPRSDPSYTPSSALRAR